MTTINKTIKDDEGKSHEYTITRHAGRAGLELSREIMPMIGSALTIDGDGDTGIDLGRALTSIAGLLSEDVTLELLRHTRRDERLLTATVFDEVYAGNYGELLYALVEVLKANFGPAIKRVIAGKGDLLADF